MTKLIPLMLSFLALTGCMDAMRKQRLVYRAIFPNSSCCVVDDLKDAPMDLQLGRSDVNETDYDWDPRSGKLKFTAPKPIVKGTSPSVGAFDTRAYYGPNSSFTLIATFQNPIGPTLPMVSDEETNAWAVGLSARNGELPDYVGLLRFTLTLRFRNAIDRPLVPTAYLTVQGIDPRPAPVEISADMYRWIVADRYPFMLVLYFDREKGNGFARLTAGNTITIPFSNAKLAIPDSESISVMGATLGNCCSPGNPTSVELKDFQIWTD